MSEPNDTEEDGVLWPGLLIRIRPAAKVAFGIVLAVGLATLVLWLRYGP